ncbi:MAG TPA: DUF86 domain-containing protein [Thermoanaerobaculia bacterium]|nr:DUF86 domain-containing protein [Thermoanaerobaculia bacterium]
MTDRDLVFKKLAAVETHVRELRAHANLERLRTDVREERFVTRTLHLAIEAALDVASHVVSDERLGEPRSNRDLFDLLERAGWLAPELATALKEMAGFRNVLVHGYDSLNLGIVEQVVRTRLDDLLAFTEVVRARS